MINPRLPKISPNLLRISKKFLMRDWSCNVIHSSAVTQATQNPQRLKLNGANLLTNLPAPGFRIASL